MKNIYFTYALLFSLVSYTINKDSEIKNNSDLIAFFKCHSINGDIQFPVSMNTIPQIPIYCAGTKNLTDTDTSRKRASYTVPKQSGQYVFYFLITEIINAKKIDTQEESNTIDHLEVAKGQKYKFFSAQLSAEKNSENSLDPLLEWVIEEKVLPDSGRIPDDAIIICCNPDFIESIEGNHYRDLPIIKMRSDLIAFTGSEEKIHDHFNAIMLATIDVNTFHTKKRQEQCIKITHNKRLIAPSTI